MRHKYCHECVFPSVSNIWEVALHVSIKFGVSEYCTSLVGIKLGLSV